MGSLHLSRLWNRVVLVLGVMALTAGGGCQDREKEAANTEVAVRALNANPKASDFVLEAENSIRLQTGGLVVADGDLGARGAGSGPFLSGGVAIDLSTGVQAPADRSVIADSVRLGTGVRVGDIQTNRLVDGTGTQHGAVSGLVPLPPLPLASTVSPGTENLTVGTGATMSAVTRPLIRPLRSAPGKAPPRRRHLRHERPERRHGIANRGHGVRGTADRESTQLLQRQLHRRGLRRVCHRPRRTHRGLWDSTEAPANSAPPRQPRFLAPARWLRL